MEIKNFEDFLKFHKDSRRPIYMVNGTLEPGYNMLERIESVYHFSYPDLEQTIAEQLLANKRLFEIIPTNKFYYPNDNMFSGNNSWTGIKGEVWYLKEN